MRPLRWLLAATLVVGASARPQRSSVVVDDGDAFPMLDAAIEDVPGNDASVLLALDDAPDDNSLPLLEDVVAGNSTDATELTQAILLALDTVPDGVTTCNRGGDKIDVLFGISVCFTDNEIGQLLSVINQAIVTAAENNFYFNDKFIQRKFQYGGYKDGACPTTGRTMPTVVFENLKPADRFQTKYDLYVNIGKDKGVSFSSQLKTYKFDIDYQLETRVCASTTNCGTAAAVVGSIDKYCDAAPAVTKAMFCPDVQGATPYTYTSKERKEQCGCKCPGDKVAKSGVCGCPGELEQLAGDTCGCTNGRSKTSDNKCACPGDTTYSASAKACVCPTGSTLTGTKCVKDCFWKDQNQGFSCLWGDETKTSLKLNADCSITAPVPKDNYVADKRTNKFDPLDPTKYGAPSDDPKITISATKKGAITGVTKATSWLNYVLSPGSLEDDVTLSSFGVFDLSMVATDYRYNAKCPGCVAVVDNYPPAPKTVCQTDDKRTDKNVWSSATLTAHVTAEDSFTSFYGATNVKNNGVAVPDGDKGDNVRCDVASVEMQDFFATTKTTTTDLAPKCFTTNYVKDLLDSAKTMSVSSLGTVVQGADQSSLVCERCCFKSVVLKEWYRKYECGKTDWAWDKQGTSNCQYGRCLKMQPKDLFAPSSKSTAASDTKTATTVAGLPTGSVTADDKTIRRSITCTAVSSTDASCWVTETLSAMLEKKSEWNAAAGVPATGYTASEYVFWRYKVGGTGTWKAWNDADTLTFKDALTAVTVEAWSRCGKIDEFSFNVALHPHSTRDVCKDFLTRWVNAAPNAPKVDGNMCAYPGSDFALLTFNYDSLDNVPHENGKVKGKYTDAKCELAVAEEAGGGAAMTKVSLPLTWPTDTNGRILISKPFAVELVKDPTTAKNTDVFVKCTFKFKYYDNSKEDTDPCETSFRLTDCDSPTLQTFTSTANCLPSECGAPKGLPGAYETCSGDVFTTVKTGAVVSTSAKAADNKCCEACDKKLSCVALTEAASIKRCQPPAGSEVLLALAMEETETVAHAVAQAMQGQGGSTPTLTLLLGASAMVAVVALVVAKKLRTAKKSVTPVVDDAYVSLLD